MELYHWIVELIDEQQKSEKHGAVFESQLKKRWKETAGGRKRQLQNEEDVGVTPRAPNHLRLSLESKGMA